MTHEWQRRGIENLLLENALYIGDGYRAKRSELAETGLPFARAGNINGGFRFQDADCFPIVDLHKVGAKLSQPGDVVFTSKGTVGRFAFVCDDTEQFVYAPQLSFWRVLDEQVIEPRFLYYWMFGRECYNQFYGLKGQTDMADYVSLHDQRRMHITLPPLCEQKAISNVLGPLDDKIELNHQMNHTLEAIARALFKSWFVDFDPVWAKANGEQPYGMEAETAALFPDAFVDSELGPIPAGWTVEPIGGHITIAKGLSYKGSGLSESGMPLHNLNSVYEGGGYKHEGIKYYTGEYQRRHIVRPGDLIVTNTEQGFDFLLIGFPAIVPARYGSFGLFTHHLFRVRLLPHSPLTTKFVYLLLMNYRFRGQVVAYTNGTTVNMLAADGLKRNTRE